MVGALIRGLALAAVAGGGALAAPAADTRVEQLSAGPPAAAGQVTQIAPPPPGAARAVQASPEARNEGDAGLEARLERPAAASPEAELYRRVAEVWQVIRRRGQQPTPELIAQEIGPERLSSFLNNFPGSENIFGVDSDRLPLKAPQDGPPGTP